MKRFQGPPELRFERHYEPEPNSGCWLWTGSRDGTGYGQIRITKGTMVQAHRLSYAMHRGPIPVGLVIDHLCRVHCCVNPAHLEVVTPQENTLRGIGPAAMKAAQTHCRRGHAFSEENTYLVLTGGRNCRRCHADSEYRRRHLKGA